MADSEGEEGLLVDIGTGVLRQDHVLVQTAPGAVLFFGLGARAEQLCRFASGDESDSDPFIARCLSVAQAVESGKLTKAQQAGLPSTVLAIKDRMLRRLAIAEALAKSGFDPDEPRDEYGRWTSEGGGAHKPKPPRRNPESRRITQEDEKAEPEEFADPLALARQALWEDGIARLRAIDPENPNLAYFANPGSPPSQGALDRLNAALEAAAIKRVTEKIMPGGMPIGTPGRGHDIQELPGGLPAAQHLFDYLRAGGTVYRSDSNITVIQLSGNAGFITFRPVSESGDPAIDVNVLGKDYLRFHFPPGRAQ